MNIFTRTRRYKSFSPICNKRFFVKEIEEHADVCLKRKTQQNIIYISSDSDAEDTTHNYLHRLKWE